MARIVNLKGIADNILLESSNVAASSLDEYASGTSYSTGDQVRVSYESDGTTPRQPVEEYESLADSNSGNYPPDSPDQWSLLGASNKWQMFDDFANTQTSNTDSIEVEIDSSDTDAVGLFNLQAKQVTLTQIVNTELITNGDATSDDFTKETGWSYDSSNTEYDCDGSQTSSSKLYQTPTLKGNTYYQVVFTIKNYSAGNIAGYAGGTSGTNVNANGTYTQIIKTGSTNEAGVIADADFSGSVDDMSVKKVPNYETIDLTTISASGWYYYLFSEKEFKNKLIWTYVRYSNSTLRVTIDYYSGEDAKCGLCAIGAQQEVCRTRFGATVGYIDYSKKTTDNLGRTYLKQGNFADRAELDGWLNNSEIDTVMQAIKATRGQPIILDANNVSSESPTDYDELKIYGYFQEPNITIPGPKQSRISIDFEGLI